MPASTARDDRRKPPAESVAANLPVAWVRGWRWRPGRPGFFTIGATMYRLDSLGADEVSESWHVSKLVERPGQPAELATPFTVCLPVPGSGFVASCDCPAETYRKGKATHCKHVMAVLDLREQAEAHDVDDDAVGVMERDAGLAK
jgi:hypothetical protein